MPRRAPLAFVLELFVSQHVKGHKIYDKTAKASFVEYLCMILLKYKEQMYNYPNINVLVLPRRSCSLNNAAESAILNYFAKLTD